MGQTFLLGRSPPWEGTDGYHGGVVLQWDFG